MLKLLVKVESNSSRALQCSCNTGIELHPSSAQQLTTLSARFALLCWPLLLRALNMSAATRKSAISSQTRPTFCQSRIEKQVEGDHYDSQQICTAWELLCRGDKDGLRRKDVDLLIRTLQPNMGASEIEQILGPVKGRMSYAQLYSTLQTDALAKVCSFQQIRLSSAWPRRRLAHTVFAAAASAAQALLWMCASTSSWGWEAQ